MLGEDKIKKISASIFKKAKGYDVELLFTTYSSHLTRFANSVIHQNVSEVNNEITIRVAKRRRVGIVSINDLSLQRVEEALYSAMEIASHTPEDPDFPGFPGGRKRYPEVSSYFRRTAIFSPIKRAEKVDIIVKIAKDYNLHAFGSVTNGESEIAVVNSKGVFAYHTGTDIFVNVTMQDTHVSGYAEATSRDVKEIDFEEVARKAAEKAVRAKNPKDIRPGKYQVILEPLATRDFIIYLAWIGFGAKAYIEKTSFMYGKIGKKVTGSNITIFDDPLNPKGFPFPFDFEGVLRKKVFFIKKGVATGVATDSKTAKKLKMKNTGHALPRGIGALPLHLHFLKGKDDFSKMISSVDNGLLVTRFHYQNIIDPKNTVITGMTRDGLFLVKKGEIVTGVKNLRFTQSILEALKKVKLIENKETLVGGGAGYEGRFPTGSLVPSLVIEEFNFTGKTEF